MNIIRMIIDRDCHVGTPYRKVVRHVASRLKGGFKSFKSMPRQDRRDFIIYCYATHYENRDLYRRVMSGQKRG